jgi:hypothetical protein
MADNAWDGGSEERAKSEEGHHSEQVERHILSDFDPVSFQQGAADRGMGPRSEAFDEDGRGRGGRSQFSSFFSRL